MTQTQPRDYVGKQFLSYQVWFNQTDNGKTQTKTFDSLRDVESWVEAANPHFWRIDMLVRVIVSAKQDEPEPLEEPTRELPQVEQPQIDPKLLELPLNQAQRVALVEAAQSKGWQVPNGPTAAALRRRGLVNVGSSRQPRALTKAGKELAEYLAQHPDGGGRL